MRVGLIVGLGLLVVVVIGCNSEDHSATKSSSWVKTSAAGKPAVAFRDKDFDYQRAVGQARRSLPRFLKRLANPQPHELFEVDASLPNSKGDREFIWLSDVKYSNGKFIGVLTDEPFDVPGKHMGDTVSVAEKDLDDWSIKYDNSLKNEGSFTAAVLNKAASAAKETD